MQNHTTKSIIIKITISLVIVLLLVLLFIFSISKKEETEDKVRQNAVTVEYEKINNINNIDEYQKKVYEQSVK